MFHVDVGRKLGDVGEDDHAVVADLDETAVHREPLLRAVLELHAGGPGVERAEELGVVLLERDVTAAERAHDDHLRFADVEHLLR